MNELPRIAEGFDGYALSERSLDYWIERHYGGWLSELPDDREFERLEEPYAI